jgi:hypothetical protein
MDEASREILMTYARLNLPHMVWRTLLGSRPFLAVTIVGQMGVGKSSYAYYSLKTGIMAYLCHPYGINLFKEADRCVAHLEGIHGELCMSRHCAKPDALDKKYALDIYTGPQGLFSLIETAAELAESGAPKRKILFLDDILARTAFFLGPEYRRAYIAFRELLRLVRAVGGIAVVTAPTKDYLPPEAVRGGEFIVGSYGMNKRRFVRMHAAKSEGKDGGIYKRLKVKFVDVVPAKAAFGMPKWLEEEITKRKRAAIASLAKIVRGGGNAAEEVAADAPQPSTEEEPPAEARRPSRAETLAKLAIERCRGARDFASFKACVEALTRRDKDALEAAKMKVFAALSKRGKAVMKWEDVAKVEGPPSAYL